MSGLFGAPFHLLQSPNLPVRESKSKKKQQPPAAVSTASNIDTTSALGGATAGSAATSLPSSSSGRVPQPQPQDLDGATLAPSCSCGINQANVFTAASTSAAASDIAFAAASDSISGTCAAAAAAAMPCSIPSDSPSVSAQFQEEHRQVRQSLLVTPTEPAYASDDDARSYSPVMDQLDETMDLLKNMQVAARAASSAQSPHPPLHATSRDKNPPPTPGISFSAHSAQKEAWLAGYSSGLAHAHAQALCHIEELGAVHTQVAAQRDAVEDLRSKYDNLASQLSFLQGTCTQAFTGIWKALGRNTSMIEERLQVEAMLQSRVDSLDARVAVNYLELQQQAQANAAIRAAAHAWWWRKLQLRAPHMTSPLLLQCLFGAAVAEFLLRYSSALFGSRYLRGRKLLRQMNALVAALSFLRLLVRVSHVARPALQHAWLLLRTILKPLVALAAAAEKGERGAAACSCRVFLLIPISQCTTWLLNLAATEILGLHTKATGRMHSAAVHFTL